LYDPLYVSRPVVEPELFASLRPVAYSGGIGDNGAVAKLPKEEKQKGLRDEEAAFKKDAKGGEGKGGGFGPGGGPGRGAYDEQTKRKVDERMDLGGGGAQSMATAAKLGDFFQYSIDKPVSLPRQKSAMLPIVNKDVDGTRVSIYNEKTQAKFPLLGLK